MAYNIIMVQGIGEIRRELIAAEAITPGHLCERTTAGTVRKHASAGGTVGPVMVALGDELQGKEIGDAYASGARVFLVIPQRGDKVYMWLNAGETVSIGERLESNGDGLLRAEATGSNASTSNQRIVAVADEALDLSGSGAVDTRILVEIL